MPSVTFLPGASTYTIEANTKILAAAVRNKVPIRFGCAACRCGTCAVAVEGGNLSQMRPDERELLNRMGLALDNSIRLACQTRIVDGAVRVDLAFQNSYSPDTGLDAADENGVAE